jgi:hypothetical protein
MPRIVPDEWHFSMLSIEGEAEVRMSHGLKLLAMRAVVRRTRSAPSLPALDVAGHEQARSPWRNRKVSMRVMRRVIGYFHMDLAVSAPRYGDM